MGVNSIEIDFEAISMDEFAKRVNIGGAEGRTGEERVAPWITGRLGV